MASPFIIREWYSLATVIGRASPAIFLKIFPIIVTQIFISNFSLSIRKSLNGLFIKRMINRIKAENSPIVIPKAMAAER